MFVASWRLITPLPESMFTNPVVLPPRVKVCPLVVCRLPRPVKYVAIFPEAPEIEAVGVPELTPVNANFEEAVDTPPKRRSRVEACFGNIVPFNTFQLDPVPVHDAHDGVVPPVRQSVALPAAV